MQVKKPPVSKFMLKYIFLVIILAGDLLQKPQFGLLFVEIKVGKKY